ncbi:MAG: peptidylprolyl isomerase [Anaerolineae bacterium]|nr:peptidylprolyl isomerase [Anaerolineae bacterium]
MAKQSTPKSLSRRQLARHEKEQNTQRTITWIAVAVIAVVVLLSGYALGGMAFQSQRKVAKVGNVNIITRDFQRRQQYQKRQIEWNVYSYKSQLQELQMQSDGSEGMQSLIQQYQIYINNLEQQLSSENAELFGKNVLDLMVEEELVRQEAAARGLTVSQEDVDIQIELSMGYDREAAKTAITQTETLTATTPMTEGTYRQNYELFKTNILEGTISEAEYRKIVEADLFKTKVQNAIGETVEGIEDQVEAVVFITGTLEGALTFQTRLNNGEVMTNTLIEELNGDTSAASGSYSLPWLPLGYLSGQVGPDVERAAFNTPIGRASDPVQGLDGSYYVIYVSGHEERALSDSLLEDARQKQYDTWLQEQIESRAEYFNWQDAIIIN